MLDGWKNAKICESAIFLDALAAPRNLSDRAFRGCSFLREIRIFLRRRGDGRRCRPGSSKIYGTPHVIDDWIELGWDRRRDFAHTLEAENHFSCSMPRAGSARACKLSLADSSRGRIFADSQARPKEAGRWP